MKKPLKAALLLLLATVFWGLSFVIMKALIEAQILARPGTSTWTLTSLSVVIRFGLSALLLVALKPGLWKSLAPLEWKQGLGLALFGGAGLLFQMDGVNYTDASTSAFLTQCYCVILPIYAAVKSRRRPGAVIIIATFMVLAGIAALSKVTPQNFKLGRGELETIAASLFFTGQILWLESSQFRETSPQGVTFVMFLLSAGLALPILLWSGPSPAGYAPLLRGFPILLLLGALTLLSTCVSYGLMNFWQPHVSATQAGLIYCAEPLFASLFSLFLPGALSVFMAIDYSNEKITSHLLAGGGLIVGANLMIIIQAMTSSRRTA